jgi:PadR family transcriptional regulator PadR
MNPHRISFTKSVENRTDPVIREVLIALWKIHILHHAAERPVYGQWITEELARHGYRISPGTLYPLLRRMETRGWISAQAPTRTGAHARRSYVLSEKGAAVLAVIWEHVAELYQEVCGKRRHAQKRGGTASGRPRAYRT